MKTSRQVILVIKLQTIIPNPTIVTLILKSIVSTITNISIPFSRIGVDYDIEQTSKNE